MKGRCSPVQGHRVGRWQGPTERGARSLRPCRLSSPDPRPPTQSPTLRYGTHQTLGARREASGESLGGWEVEMGAGEAPGGRWPGAPQALAGEGMMVAVTVTLLPWQEGWEQTKSWASSSVRLSHCASDTATEPGLKPTAPPSSHEQLHNSFIPHTQTEPSLPPSPAPNPPSSPEQAPSLAS